MAFLWQLLSNALHASKQALYQTPYMQYPKDPAIEHTDRFLMVWSASRLPKTPDEIAEKTRIYSK